MKRVIYTALIGNYERVVAKAAVPSKDLTYLCFTDDARVEIPGWQTVVVEPTFPSDPVRSARALKIRGHDALSEFEESLWLDNRIEPLAPPEELFQLFLKDDSEFGAPYHSFRTTLEEEFKAILRCGYDDPRRVREQRKHYAVTRPEILKCKPIWTAMIARKSTPQVLKFNTLWADNVMRYSRRDQLSVVYALQTSGIRASLAALDNIQSPYHRWIDEARMSRRLEVSRWRSGGGSMPGGYSAQDFAEDSVFRVKRRLSSVRSLIRQHRTSGTAN